MDSIKNFLTKYQKIAKGKREICRSLESDKLLLVCVASDAEPDFISELEGKCASRKVDFLMVGETRGEIGKAINIAVSCAALGFYK